MIRVYVAAILAIFVLHVGTTAVASSRDDLQMTSNIITDILPLAALGTVYFKGDSEGGKQWLRDTVLYEVLYSGLILGFNETSLGKRPNGGPYSFPSGHAGFAFAQAGFLRNASAGRMARRPWCWRLLRPISVSTYASITGAMSSPAVRWATAAPGSQ